VTKLERECQQLLWLWTEGYLDRWAEQDEVSIDEVVDEDIVQELYNRVCDVAANEPLTTDPDEDDDRERDEQDMDLFRAVQEEAVDDEPPAKEADVMPEQAPPPPGGTAPE